MEYRTRKIVTHKDLNSASTLFGGQALSWIDEESAIYCLCQLPHANHLVTKTMSKVNFMAPAQLGDIVEIGTETVKIGTTSITVSCAIRNKTTMKDIVIVDEIVFVNLDNAGKPITHHISLEDAYRNRDAMNPMFVDNGYRGSPQYSLTSSDSSDRW